jgi:hypothetical protein
MESQVPGGEGHHQSVEEPHSVFGREQSGVEAPCPGTGGRNNAVNRYRAHNEPTEARPKKKRGLS